MAKIKKTYETNDFKAIVYTDGATSPTNPGYSGSSVHGYIYNIESITQKTSDKPNNVNITTKGYLIGNVEAMPNIELVKPSYYVDGMFIHKMLVTNNVAELHAIAFAIDNLLVQNELYTEEEIIKITEITILSDSAYSIGVFEKVKLDNSWMSNKDISNYEYYKIFRELLDKCSNKGITVNIEKVKGHDVSIGNHIADRLAVGARIMAANNSDYESIFNIMPANKYWSPHLDRHPLLKYRQLFFMNVDRDNSKPVYSIINYKNGIELGKKSPEPMFGTYMPKETIPEIEVTIEEFLRIAKDKHVSVATIDLDVLYNQRTSLYYNILGKEIYNPNNKNTQLMVLDENAVAYLIFPSGLPMRALEQMMVHQDIIESYINNSNKYEFIDLTDKIYDKTGKKNVCILEQGTDKLDINIKYFGRDVLVPLSLGVDLPDRNKLKNMEADDIHVKLVVENCGNVSFNYYILIEDKTNNDYSCWCNFFSNKCFLPSEK